MTKSVLYGKITIMKIYFTKKSKFCLIALFAAVLIICSAFFATGYVLTFADQSSDSVKLYTPLTNLEYKELSSPTDVYSDESVTAIVQGQNNNKSLLIYVNGAYREPLTGFDALKQVKKADQNTLLVSDNGSIYSIDLTSSSKTPVKDTDNNSIGGNNFDLNGKHLITAYGDTGLVYEKTSDGYRKITNLTVNNTSPIAINENGEIFYINANAYLCKLSANNLSDHTIISNDTVSPVKMIADNDYVYFITGIDSVIYRISVNGGDIKELSPDGKDAKYDLGKLNQPQGLAFRNDNLLVASGNTVQEFSVKDGLLSFTGFAISSGKTAYNRVGESACNIEQYGNVKAVLDNYKLSIVYQKNADKYSRENFKDYFEDDLGGSLPKSFALGKSTVLLSYNHGTSASNMRLLTLDGGALSDTINAYNANIIRDICYQSGVYYVLTDNGGAPSRIFAIDEKERSLSEIFDTNNFEADRITVDVYGNVYLSNTSEVYLYSKKDDYSSQTVANGFTNIKKLATDLGSGLFVLDDSGIGYCYKSQNEYLKVTVSLSDNDSDIKSFSMNFDDKTVCLLYNGNECIYTTKNLPNLALSELTVPAEYITTAENADVEALKIYTATKGANVYSVDKNAGKFDFKDVIPVGEEYAYICSIVQTNKYNASVTLYALAGQNGVVLIDYNGAIDVTEKLNLSEAPTSAFVTTDVNGYFFPIITANGEYSLSAEEKSLRLTKSTEIKPKKALTFLSQEYYFAEFVIDGKTYKGYIPKAFTVEILSEDFKWNEYSIETVHKTTLYSDAELTTEIIDLENGSKIRLLEKNETVATVAVSDGSGGWIKGYISVSSIADEPNRAVRNILIILAVAACVCGTATYFVLRKKVN